MPVQTVVLATPTSRQGTFTSSSFFIPANILRLELQANIALADKLSTGLTCELDVQHSPDGTTWTSLVGFGWTSYGPAGYHTIDKNGVSVDNPDPSISFAPGAFLGDSWRVVVSIPQAMTVGATAVVTT